MRRMGEVTPPAPADDAVVVPPPEAVDAISPFDQPADNADFNPAKAGSHTDSHDEAPAEPDSTKPTPSPSEPVTDLTPTPQ